METEGLIKVGNCLVCGLNFEKAPRAMLLRPNSSSRLKFEKSVQSPEANGPVCLPALVQE